MSSKEIKAIPLLYYEEAYNKGNPQVVDMVYDKNIISHTPSGEIKGTKSMKEFISMNNSAFPDLQFTIKDQIAEGDGVVMRWSARGTHKGELMGIPPTGKQVVVTGIGISRFVGDKIVEQWNNWDGLGLMQQLGVVPAMGEGGG